MSTATTPPHGVLPREIKASTMVVRSKRSKLRHIAEWVITLLAWVAFLYLLIRGIMAVGSNQLHGVDMPFFSRALPSLDTLIVYALAMVLMGVMLLLWALYNWSRFHGKTRRNNASELSDERLMRGYGVDQSMLLSLRSRPISVIHHSADGAITNIAASREPMLLHGSTLEPRLS